MNPEILQLKNESGSTCVTITMPTHSKSPERQEDPKRLKKLIEKCKANLEKPDHGDGSGKIMKSLDGLMENIDFLHELEGIGIYVSGNLSKIIKFPFPVQESLHVGKSFRIKELLHKDGMEAPYFVLTISEKWARLFNGKTGTLTEIKNDKFPMVYVEEYEYEKPSIGSSATHALKSFEKDKSTMEEIRLQSFFQKVDQALKGNLTNQTPLVVVGSAKEISLFENESRHKNSIAGKVSGNYEHNQKELESKSWSAIQKYNSNNKEQLISSFREIIGRGHGVTGLGKIWQAANEGRGMKLIIEKDYSKSGFVTENENKLYLSRPYRKKFHPVDDVAELLIETILHKQGEVVFVDNGRLADYDGLALITRY